MTRPQYGPQCMMILMISTLQRGTPDSRKPTYCAASAEASDLHNPETPKKREKGTIGVPCMSLPEP